MKTQLILLDIPIIVSDEKHKKDDFIIHKFFWKKIEGYNGINKCKDNSGSTDEWWYKVIAGLPKLPQIDFNGFEEQLGIVDIEKAAFRQAYGSNSTPASIYRTYGQEGFLNGFIKGFKAAQKLNEKKFSEIDLRKAYLAGFRQHSKHFDNDGNIIKDYIDCEDDYIITISQPKVFDIEIEMEDKGGYRQDSMNSCWISRLVPKITNNSIKIIKIL